MTTGQYGIINWAGSGLNYGANGSGGQPNNGDILVYNNITNTWVSESITAATDVTTAVLGDSAYSSVWSGKGNSTGSPLTLITPWDQVIKPFPPVSSLLGTAVTICTIPVKGSITVVEYFVEARDSVMTNYGFFTNTAIYNGQTSPVTREGALTQSKLPSGTTISCTDSASGSNIIIEGTGVASSNITWRVWAQIWSF
jgi:hypothetical protein